MKITKSTKILNLFILPDWARWVASVSFGQEMKIQIASLKYPRWNMSYYPVFLSSDNTPLYPFPKDLGEAANDHRRWDSCPEKIWYRSDNSEFIFESYDEGDHPRPPHSARYRICPPNYLCELIEGKTGDYSLDLGATPRLSNLQDQLQSAFVELLPGVTDIIFSKAPPGVPPWPVEKRK